MRFFLNPSDKPSLKDVEQAIDNFGFYHDKVDVERMYAEYVNHGNYGYAGGVMEQPEAYWHDMSIMKWLSIWVEHYAPLAYITDGVSIFQKAEDGQPIL